MPGPDRPVLGTTPLIGANDFMIHKESFTEAETQFAGRRSFVFGR